VGYLWRGTPVADDAAGCADQQGQLQGATLERSEALSQLVGPISVHELTFSYFIGAGAPLHLPGAPFLLAAALMVLCAAIAVRTLAATKQVS